MDVLSPTEKRRICSCVLHSGLTSLLAESLQLRVLGFGFFQNGNVGIGVFPEGEEVFVGGEGATAGEVGIRSL